MNAHILRMKKLIADKEKAAFFAENEHKRLLGHKPQFQCVEVSSIKDEIDTLNISLSLIEQRVEMASVFIGKEHYWQTFEELMPDLLDNFSYDGIIEEIDTQVEIRREKEAELDELAEGRKPEDYGVPRGS